MHLRRGTVGEGKREWGGKGGSVYDFQVSKGRVPRNKGRDFEATKEDYQKGLGHAPPCIYRANKRLCLGYK